MNNILRRAFHVVAALSYGWLALLFVSLSMLANQAGYSQFETVFDIGVVGAGLMVLASLFAGCRILWRESLFITKASTIFFSLATIVYIWLLLDSGIGVQFEWSLVGTALVAVFGALTLNNPVVPKDTAEQTT